MPYVYRVNGIIKGLFSNKQDFAIEFLPYSNQEIIDFNNPPPTQQEIDINSAKQYTKLDNLSKMSIPQVQAWVDNNVTNLSEAKDAIKTLCVAVSILSRRL